ncbi:MAG TPA: glycosyltransferase [Chitinophagaceae bacterium]|nr:glycosyltransferase [Chitinophagaceae bacterium]
MKKFIRENKIDAVISDNRFGMYYKKVVSVYITHQLLIKTGNRFTEKLAQDLHYFFIKNFNTCWVPDYAENGLAGDLSHPKNTPRNIRYIGFLSRFEKITGSKKVREVLIIISGPEPQRTIFEEKIISQLSGINKKVLLVRGLPDEPKILQTGNKITAIENHLSSEEMNMAIQESEVIICRSGYSTIMDLVKLGCAAVIVPTPGQTEQEYLGEYLMQQKYFYCISQDDFKIREAMGEAAAFQFSQPDFPLDYYKKALNEFVQSLKSGKFAAQ